MRNVTKTAEQVTVASAVQAAIRRARERGIVLPTFEEMMEAQGTPIDVELVEFGGGDDTVQMHRVGQEVLAQPFGRPDFIPRQQPRDGRGVRPAHSSLVSFITKQNPQPKKPAASRHSFMRWRKISK